MFAPRDCRAEFRPAARRYRKLSLLIGCLAWVAAGCAVLYFFPQTERWGALALAACIVILVAGRLFLLATFRCPACRKALEVSPTKHCPECSSTKLSGHTFWSLRDHLCTSCGAVFSGRRRRGRHYKIRFCHHCGSHLHDRGL